MKFLHRNRIRPPCPRAAFLRVMAVFLVLWFALDCVPLLSRAQALILAGLLAAPLLLPRRLPPRAACWLPRLCWAVGPWTAFLAVEVLNNNNPWNDLTLAQGVLNAVWYYLIFSALYLIIGRLRGSALTASALCLLIGVANHYVLVFRGRVIFPCDLAALQTAMNVAGGFDFTPDRAIVTASLITLAYVLLLTRLPRVKGRHMPRLRVAVPLCGAACAYILVFFATPLLPSIGIYAQQWKTQANGFLLNFTAALRYSIVTEPEGYSPQAVQAIAQDYPAPARPDGVQPVHILAIMNESFADLSAYDGLTLSEDPIPFLHSLTENTIKGTMYSPVTGGGTANVEFEFLTGNNLSFLPPSTVAYQLYLHDNTPGLARQLKTLGYHTVAFHPYLSSGWNRTAVYQWMGFDRQLYEQDVVDPEYIRGFISDASDYEQLYRLTDQAGENPLFVFNVTMQNHSGYDLPWSNLERTSVLSGDLEGENYAADQFFSLMRESDDALRELIGHYEQSDQPTMIILFGDHQPPLGNDFYQDLAGKPLDDRTTGEVFDQYGTPFFIWANYDIPEADNVVLSAYQLGVLTAQAANLPLTGYQSFLASLGQHLPVITPVGFISSDGTIYSDESQLPAASRKLLNNYRLLAYDNVFGGFSRLDPFFFLPSDP